MSKVLFKYFLLLFVALQGGAVHLGAELVHDMESCLSMVAEGNVEPSITGSVAKNQYFPSDAFAADTEKWPFVISEFEQEEENRHDPTGGYVKTTHPFSVFLATSLDHADCVRLVKDHLSASKHFPSFYSLFLRFQVFRL